ncbi:MAG: hypothetical protein HWD59_09290 [Coxiellaceae bacterium]|nr:MAG: hypothetical protein HWD59_09290 [Coxiellaceae bacterium]
MPTALINNYLKQINDIVDLIKSRHKDNPSFQQELKYLDQQHIHIKIQIEQLKENESQKPFKI